MWQHDVYRIIQRRGRYTGIKTRVWNHTFRSYTGSGIGPEDRHHRVPEEQGHEAAQHIANHSSPRTTNCREKVRARVSSGSQFPKL